MRSLIVTHNIGHSVLEGFENRFAPVVLEDRAQVGLGAVLYAGAGSARRRSSRRTRTSSARFPPGRSRSACRRRRPAAPATSSPTRAGSTSHAASSTTSTSSSPSAATTSRRSRTTASRSRARGSRSCESYRGGVDAPAVVLALDVRGDVPEGVAVLDLLGRQRARQRGRRPRLGPGVLPQARHQVRAGAVELPRRPRLNGGIRDHPGSSCVSVLGCARRGEVSKARPGWSEGRRWFWACRARRVRLSLRRRRARARPAARLRVSTRPLPRSRSTRSVCSTSQASPASASA